MSKTIDSIVLEAGVCGELEDLTATFKIVGLEFTNKFQGISEERYGDGAAIVFNRRVYIRWNGSWYDGTNHPNSPFPEFRDFVPGYHMKKIDKRRFGSFGKIQEELEEALDAHQQGSHIMMLVELSDMYGAMEGFLAENYPGFTMEDLKKFSSITRRAFENGHRG